MKGILIICLGLALVVVLGALFTSCHRADRRVAIIWAEQLLADAYNSATNNDSQASRSDYQVLPSSNSPAIDGIKYQCALELRWGRFENQGVLAITTNRMFIWIGRDGRSKVIPVGYRPPLFGF